MHRMHVWAGSAALLVLVLVSVAWLILSPGWAVGLLQTQAQQQLGRVLEVKGGASLEFSPRLAIRLDQASLANPDGQDGSFITARSLRIPLSLSGLITHNADLSNLALEGAEFAFLVNERNDVSWAFAAVKTPMPLNLDITDGAMRFYDTRTEQAFSLSGARMQIALDGDGGVIATGTADIGGRLARIDADLKSLPRVNGDGSPLDLSVEVPEGTVSFTGRLSTATLLNLAGPVTISSPGLVAAAHWAGLPVERGEADNAVAIEGAMESTGRAFAIRHAKVQYGKMAATGDLVLDLRGAVPKLQAALATHSLDLASFLPTSGRSPGQWGTKPLGFSVLKAFDADMTIEAGSIGYGTAVTGPCRVVVALAGGKLKSSLSFLAIGQGRLVAETEIDASAIPPRMSLNVTADDANLQTILPSLLDIPWLAGKGSFAANLAGTGNTEQEIVGTLNGDVSLSMADGVIAGPDFAAMLSAVSQRILQGWSDGKPGQTSFTVFGAAATVKDGIATLGPAKLESPTQTITIKGDVDLLRHAVDLKAEPSIIADGKSAALPVPLIVKGPWDNPRFYPDLPGILENPQKAYETLKSMGLPAGN